MSMDRSRYTFVNVENDSKLQCNCGETTCNEWSPCASSRKGEGYGVKSFYISISSIYMICLKTWLGMIQILSHIQFVRTPAHNGAVVSYCRAKDSPVNLDCNRVHECDWWGLLQWCRLLLTDCLFWKYPPTHRETVFSTSSRTQNLSWTQDVKRLVTVHLNGTQCSSSTRRAFSFWTFSFGFLFAPNFSNFDMEVVNQIRKFSEILGSRQEPTVVRRLMIVSHRHGGQECEWERIVPRSLTSRIWRRRD